MAGVCVVRLVGAHQRWVLSDISLLNVIMTEVVVFEL